jgi:hypothetical protein
MLTGKIEFTGKTSGDVEQALLEALTRIKAGNTSGFDRNSDASFSFTVDGEEDAFSDEDA